MGHLLIVGGCMIFASSMEGALVMPAACVLLHRASNRHCTRVHAGSCIASTSLYAGGGACDFFLHAALPPHEAVMLVQVWPTGFNSLIDARNQPTNAVPSSITCMQNRRSAILHNQGKPRAIRLQGNFGADLQALLISG
jgi:hypothetical protein